jgi:hypothetical protein
MGNLISTINNKKDICGFCKLEIDLNDYNPYYFKIYGLGKHNTKNICIDCLHK